MSAHDKAVLPRQAKFDLKGFHQPIGFMGESGLMTAPFRLRRASPT
jgi:hypothetical protein